MTVGQPKTLVCLAVYLALAGFAAASEGPPQPGPKDRCATCGMFVSKYPIWVATIVYADAPPLFFDGPKDLFRYREGDGAGAAETEIWVTDYYTARPIEARDAFFVRGSDVLGPMGAELVPFSSEKLAEGFRADHGGEEPLAFDEIDAAVLKALD